MLFLSNARKYGLVARLSVRLSVRTFSLEPWQLWIPNVDMWVGIYAERSAQP